MSGEKSGGRQPTTVNVADLDISQLADVKRQLDQASPIHFRDHPSGRVTDTIDRG